MGSRVFLTICMIIMKMEVLVFQSPHIPAGGNILDPSKLGWTVENVTVFTHMINFSYETMYYDDYYTDDLGFIPGLSFFKK